MLEIVLAIAKVRLSRDRVAIAANLSTIETIANIRNHQDEIAIAGTF